MIFYSLQETLLLIAAAIAIDWIIGDPKWPTHPVIWIGRLIRMLEKLLRGKEEGRSAGQIKGTGMFLTAVILLVSFGSMWGITAAAAWIHPWLGYAVSAWYISTTIAVKGLKDAAMLVYRPLIADNIGEARKYVGYIVGRDTEHLTPSEASRAAVETVAENTVDAFVSPILFALLGAAPLAMLYRAANTLDSMVGYRNNTYVNFGWCSARTDDVLNYVPARITGLMLTLAALLNKGMSAARSWSSVRRFARFHPSPNSGIPESAVAGALGIELGGLNYYFGQPSERARMGWPLRTMVPYDIVLSVRLLYTVSILMMAGVLGVWLCLR
ncbi:adenosylcobinamide-phosphate synthase CbiB [Paenibacillus glycanilyticus]|uniref:adenosylcobinamide-phosphate synthase CbiB n=1 Tax=Paenibacillus glycanilyticus TaxID=126569 RepID=UPI00203E0929|nr:adenosylcobinamide-phosphate synthase CbiB [Paenibacillus glycanilyticus]MCM3625849.1 adenosylcobinamide-phosphate synthase CbiB [Paenibacillus glycanilyticus]